MAGKKSRQKVTAEDLGADIIRSMDAEFHDASDRVLAIVGAAYLDSVLEQLLRAAFLDDAEEADRLLAPDRAIGANGARYQLAYCLRLISADQRDDLKTIAKIRNLFAHKYAVRSFDDEEPGKYLATLHYAKQREAVVKDLMATERDPRRRNGLERAPAPDDACSKMQYGICSSGYFANPTLPDALIPRCGTERASSSIVSGRPNNEMQQTGGARRRPRRLEWRGRIIFRRRPQLISVLGL